MTRPPIIGLNAGSSVHCACLFEVSVSQTKGTMLQRGLSTMPYLQTSLQIVERYSNANC